MYQLIIIILLFVTIASSVMLQDVVLPLACVAEADNLVLKEWGYTALTFPINDEHWQTFTQMAGDTIWIGYPDGWSVPGDVRGAWEIEGDINDSPVSIWIWSSEETGEYYIFPFVNTELFADGNGAHYGMHPCGGWKIDKSEFILTAIDVINGSGE